MLRFIHLADLHLGTDISYLGDIADQRSKDFTDAFERAVDYAVDPENNIHLVIIAGDLFDRHNPTREISRVAIDQFKRLNRAGIPAVLAPGNHDSVNYPDSIYQDTSTEIRDLVTFIDCPNVEHVKVTRSLTVELSTII